MDPRIPTLLHPLLEDTTRRLQPLGWVTACYLEGSIALGGFQPRLSDVDFIAVLSRRAAESDLQSLRQAHAALERQHPDWKLSGMYCLAGDLGCLERPQEPFLNYQDGKLARAARFELSSVTWWILKNRGLALFGPPADSLDLQVDMQHLLQVQRDNLNTYWAGWTTRPRRWLALLSDWGVQWTVLGVLRQYYTLNERQITTKVGAGEYAIKKMPVGWHPIIREAMALRAEPKMSFYHSRLERARQCYRFLKYVIEACNDL